MKPKLKHIKIIILTKCPPQLLGMFPSVWRAKCEGFHRKMKDFGASGVQGQRGFGENGLKVDLSMESKM